MKNKLIIFAFIMGIIFCAKYSQKNIFENFDNKSNCPTLLVRRGNKIMLLNKNKAEVPGVNPIFFNNLEEYTEFYEWQKSQGIYCPVLHFSEIEDAQGNTRYRMLDDIFTPRAGYDSYMKNNRKVKPLYDANHNSPPFNSHSYPGFDPQSQNTGRFTALDKIFNDNSLKSSNAMDTNWAGREYTIRQIEKGKFDRRFRPKTSNLNSNISNNMMKNKVNKKSIGHTGKKTGDSEKDRKAKVEGRI